jgi:6-pyruvoyl-tetrahydropterin synthase related domain
MGNVAATSPVVISADKRRRNAAPILLILAVSLAVGYPVLRFGMLPRGHDSIEHLQWYSCFADQIWSGDLFPRWLERMNAGLGSPSFFVYAPLPYYLASILRPLSRSFSVASPENFEMGISVWIAVALSGLVAYMWLRQITSRNAAVFGSLVYLLAPYHLSVDLYARGAVPELWSFAWIPLALYFASRALATNSSLMTAGLAGAYALLIITHIFTALLFTLVLIGYGLHVAVSTGRPRQIVMLGLALALGVALSAFYLFPALAHERNIPASRLIELRLASHFEGNFLFADPEWHRNTGRADFLWKVSWTTITAALVTIAAFAWIVLKSGWHKLRGTFVVFWLIVALGSLAMMLPISAKLWEAIPALAALQFPWRFNITLTLAAAALTGLAAEKLDIRRVNACAVLAAGIAAFLLVWAALDLKSANVATPWRPEMKKLVAGDYLYPAWAKWTAPEFLTVDGVANIERRLEAGRASGQRYIQVTGARSAFFEVEGTHEWLTLRRFFYPGLTAKTNSGQDVELRPSPGTGLIDIKVPEGPQRIQLILPWSGAEKTGLCLTILAALVIGYLILRPDTPTTG